MERAAEQDRESNTFGLWASMGLELLARAALSKISPTLLAEPDKEQRNILHALGYGSGSSPKSIATMQVLMLCRSLIPEFTEDEFKSASSLVSRRNDELHTGTAAFQEYPMQNWLPGFYRCCKVLSEFQGESLKTLLGDDEAAAAEHSLQSAEESTLGVVKSQIAAHRRVFQSKDAGEQQSLAKEAQKKSDALAHSGHHRVSCPACRSTATVQGDVYGGERVEHHDRTITIRQSVVPTRFCCLACGLKLTGYGELHAAGVADHYTQRREYTPEEYYGLVDPSDHEAMREYAGNHNFFEFNNE
ncbi:MAG TPA: hypothetical protein VFR91_05415 [Dyella sp.]|nr:hypothetical protein [Dyella sp.]